MSSSSGTGRESLADAAGAMRQESSADWDQDFERAARDFSERDYLMLVRQTRIIIQEQEEEKLGIPRQFADGASSSTLNVETHIDDAVDVSNRKSESSGNYFAHLELALPGTVQLIGTATGLAACSRSCRPRRRKEKLKEPKQPWPAEARAIAQSLLRTEQLAPQKGGLEIDRRNETFDARSGDLAVAVADAGPGVAGSVVGPLRERLWADHRAMVRRPAARRLRRCLSVGPPAGSDGGRSGNSRHSPLLGRPRADVRSSRPISDYSVELSPQGDGKTLLVLRADDPTYEIRILVDTTRHVVLSFETVREGKVIGATKYDEFVEVAGSWWAGRVETFDEKGRRIAVTTQRLAPQEPDAFAQQMKGHLAGRERVQFLQEPAVSVAEAKRATAAGKASFDDRMTLLGHFLRSQQWTRVREQLAAAEKLAAGKPGMQWVRGAMLIAARRNEEAKKWLMEWAGAGPLSLRERVRVRAWWR